MALTKNTFLESFFVRGDGNGGIQGAHVEYLEIVMDGTQEIARRVTPAQPINLVPEALAPIIGEALSASLLSNSALNEQITVENAAKAEAESARDKALADAKAAASAADEANAKIAELTAQLAALQGQASSGVPQRVATVGLLMVLRKQGQRAKLDALIDAMPPAQAADMRDLMQMPYTRRDHPVIEMLREAFGWTDAEVDALFAEADLV